MDSQKDKDFETIEEIIKWLDSIPMFPSVEVNDYRGSYDFSYGVGRVGYVLSKLGDPQDKLNVIHVAGSNGKGSVCRYIEGCLMEVGLSVGTFISPHLIDIRERIRINANLIDEKEFIQSFNEVYKKIIILKSEIKGFEISYFEYFFLTAILFYKKVRPDVVILETGMGGRLDATNVIKKPLISVITAIGLEHTAVLGRDISAIASEKCGIIKKDVPVVAQLPEENDVKRIIEDVAKHHDSEIIWASAGDISFLNIGSENIDFSLKNEYYKNVTVRLPVPAYYEVVNACTALLTFSIFIKKYGNIFSLSCRPSELLKKGADALAGITFEGRMERLNPGIYADGAHNPQGMTAFTESVSAFAKDKENVILLGISADKALDDMIEILLKSGCFKVYVFTGTAGSRRAVSKRLLEIFNRYTDDKNDIEVFSADDDGAACELALEKKKKHDGYLFITGSLYLVGEIKQYLKKRK